MQFLLAAFWHFFGKTISKLESGFQESLLKLVPEGGKYDCGKVGAIGESI